MTRTILSLRLNRRAIGVAVLVDEALTMVDERHLVSSRQRVVPTAIRYVRRMLEQRFNFAAQSSVARAGLRQKFCAPDSGLALESRREGFFHLLPAGRGHRAGFRKF